MSDCRAHAVLAVALAVACSVDPQSGFTGVSGGTVASTVASDGSSGSGSSGAGSSDTGSGSSASSDTTASTAVDSSGAADESSSATTNATTETSSGGDGTPLDPDLDVPDMGEHCTTPGDLNECPGIAVCRFATVEYGICESCDACGNLNAPCVQGTDCDILFSCYAGHCTNFCTLGTSECGPVDACLDIGHPTKGVCDPFA